MGGDGRRYDGGAVVFPLFLVAIGIVLLLQTLGVLAWDLWATLWKFWPVFLVLLGLGLVLRRAPRWMMPVLTVALLGGAIGVAIAIHGTVAGGQTYSGTFSEPLGITEKARVEMDFSAGTLLVGALPASSDMLVEGEFEGASREVRKTVRRTGSETTVTLSRDWEVAVWPGSPKEEWDVRMARGVPLDLDVDSGASEADMDLTDLDVYRFKLNVGAADIKVTFPRVAGETEATVKAGAARLELIVPEGVAASITLKSGLSSVDVDESRFPKDGDRYQSPDYDTAPNRLALSVETGVATVKVR
jgi:hypothetical protein